jgi:hypothetical protein
MRRGFDAVQRFLLIDEGIPADIAWIRAML